MRTKTFILSLLFALAVVVACTQIADEPTPTTQDTAAASKTVAAAPVDPTELLPNGKRPFDGVLTGGQPTPEQFETLAELGYKTVINLRSPDESGSTDPATVEELDMTYLSLPLAGADDISEENARQLAEVLAAAEYPVVVHCGSGNRVGALFAMKAYYVDGQTPEEALVIGRAAGVTRLEPVVEEKLGLE